MPAKLTGIFIYPIKSLNGISLEEIELTERGLAFDRRWVLVDENNFHITRRECDALFGLKQAIEGSNLIITHPESKESLSFEIGHSTGVHEKVQVWDDSFMAKEVNAEISFWLSQKLNRNVRLMYQPDDADRKVDPKYAVIGTEQVSCADAYPVLVISEESLQELNAKLSEPVEMERFRPNLVICGTTPYGEDELAKVTIGESELIGVKNCARCVMITKDPVSGKSGKEPLKTLNSYRNVNNKVIFGRNFLISQAGKISVGEFLVTT